MLLLYVYSEQLSLLQVTCVPGLQVESALCMDPAFQFSSAHRPHTVPSLNPDSRRAVGQWKVVPHAPQRGTYPRPRSTLSERVEDARVSGRKSVALLIQVILTTPNVPA